MLPLWAGAIPSGIAYGVTAAVVGMGIFDTQLMSVVVFSAAAQVSVVALVGAGAPFILMLSTILALNAQLPLLGLTIGRRLHPTWPQRLLAAFFLTDAAFGIAATGGKLRIPTLLGTGVSMFLGWNLGTMIGLAIGRLLPDPRQLGLDFVVTLSFLAVLVPAVRTRIAVLVVIVAALTTILLVRLVPSGIAILGAGITGCAAGAMADRWQRSGTR